MHYAQEQPVEINKGPSMDEFSFTIEIEIERILFYIYAKKK